MNDLDQIAAEAWWDIEKKIKYYPSSTSRCAAIAIIKSACEKATKFYQDHIDIYVEDNRRLHAAAASPATASEHIVIDDVAIVLDKE